MSDIVQCEFKHIPSVQNGKQLVDNIQTFTSSKIFDKKGIASAGKNGNDSAQFAINREHAFEIRDQLIRVLPEENSPIWFCIKSDPLEQLIPRSLSTYDIGDSSHSGSQFSLTCHFGSMRSYNQFYSHEQFDNKIVNVSFRPARKIPDSLWIEFDDFRIEISFDSIQKRNILVNKENHKNGVNILIPLKYAPSVYRLERVKGERGSNQNTNYRPVRLCGDESMPRFIGEIGFSSDVVFIFPPSPNEPWLFLYHFLMDSTYKYEINFSSFKISDWFAAKKENRTPDPFEFSHASFQDRYHLQVLISLGYLFRDKWAQSTDAELKWSEWKAEERSRLCYFTVEQLCKDHGYNLAHVLNDYNATKNNSTTSDFTENTDYVSQTNRNHLKIACCTLTPLRFILRPLQDMMGNRVLRHPRFQGPERFLLVHFRDEDNTQLFVSDDTIKKRLKTTMQKGIPIINKTFKYMGASTGQMKEMGFWFIDLPTDLKTMKDAHGLLGNFDKIKNIATYIARVGQYFSSTKPLPRIQLIEKKDGTAVKPSPTTGYVMKIDDIEIENNGRKYCFTDGVGKISLGLAGRVAQALNLQLTCVEDIPSAYQVRVAGCKGMVAIDPDSTLNDYYMHVRESMMKFESDDWSLEICEFSRPMTLTLNNQVIRLLSDLGNPDSRFIALQNQALFDSSSVAIPSPDNRDIDQEKRFAYSTSKDNLLRNRVPIPSKDGRNIFGIADETRELQYGQCFIQVSVNPKEQYSRKYRIITGPVLVTKNPCLWPGDFRRLMAVRNSKLEKCMRDVIVFPTTGERPHPNEISGSDLDGDQYWVYWGDGFRIERDNVRALSYAAAEKALTSDIDEDKIINHIVNSFESSAIVGMIANTHTVVAEKHESHSYSEECKQLAEMFSIAVDSPKTGKFIKKEEIKPFQMKYCKDWPVYMMKRGQPRYEAMTESVLGKLFRKAEQQYHKLRETPNSIHSSRKMRQKPKEPVVKINDASFKEWFCEFNDDSKPNPPKKKDIPKTTETDTDKAAKTPRRKPMSHKDNKGQDSPSPSDLGKPTPEVSVVPKESNKSKSGKTTDSDQIKASAPPVDHSSLPSQNDSFYSVDFLMGSDTKVTASTAIKFSPDGNGLDVVNIGNKENESIDMLNLRGKLVSNIKKHEVFKKRQSLYNEAHDGQLCLSVFYGHIYFTKQDPPPLKFGDLKILIEQDYQRLIQFRPADLKDWSHPDATVSSGSTGNIDYEFECYLSSASSSCSSQFMTLLYDNNKKLQRIQLNKLWYKCFVRQPNCAVDSVYEIRSIITYEVQKPEALSIIDSIFKGQETSLLGGRKPKITINRDILKPSVMPISLKIIEKHEQIETTRGRIFNSFYRRKKIVPIDKQPTGEPTAYSTLEYCAVPIDNSEQYLEQVCDYALSPTKKLSSIRLDSATSTASTASSLPSAPRRRPV